jgi:CBS domain-containing protein
MTVIRISREQHRALNLLASNRHGVNEELLVRGHGLSRGVLSSLTRRRLAVRQLPVVDDGELISIVSIGDLVKSIISDREFVIEQLEHYIRGAKT